MLCSSYHSKAGPKSTYRNRQLNIYINLVLGCGYFLLYYFFSYILSGSDCGVSACEFLCCIFHTPFSPLCPLQTRRAAITPGGSSTATATGTSAGGTPGRTPRRTAGSTVATWPASTARPSRTLSEVGCSLQCNLYIFSPFYLVIYYLKC